jgi:hypothetical protein
MHHRIEKYSWDMYVSASRFVLPHPLSRSPVFVPDRVLRIARMHHRIRSLSLAAAHDRRCLNSSV